MAGLRAILPEAGLVLSINGGSAQQSAYRLTQAAFDVHPEISLIFGINDSTASGAIQACADREVAPDSLEVVPFGLEGDTLRDSLMSCDYCRAGLAMFPEIVGPTCIEAAILAYNDQPFPPHLLTPHAVLTPDNLTAYYRKTDSGWALDWERVARNLALPLPLNRTASGITAEFGLSHTNLTEVAIEQAMIRAAREVVVLADHTKFG